MNLTLFSDYSLRILMYAAVQGEKQFSVDAVAEAYKLSRHHVAKAVNFLAQEGYLTAKRGRGGGIYLAKPPAEIRIGQLLRVTETGTPFIECFDASTNTCPLIKSCGLKGALFEAWNAFFDTLDKYTLADFVKRPERLQQALSLSS
ncbi:MAG: nsrR [Verrucomicrobia bacterium]|jgi:Rrf2 family nitric oxide-sensitive transcriptional repressor|nr:nsrR [Verrucomicrobiota bacterium]